MVLLAISADGGVDGSGGHSGRHSGGDGSGGFSGEVLRCVALRPLPGGYGDDGTDTNTNSDATSEPRGHGGGIRASRLNYSDTCEMKRLYVAPRR